VPLDVPTSLSNPPSEQKRFNVTDLYLSSENNSDITIEDQYEISEYTLIELRNARYMALNHVAISDTAKSLCRWLAQEAAGADQARKRGRRGQKREQFESAVTAVVADLLIGYSKELSSMSYRSVSPNTFSESPLSYRNFTSIMRGFRALGLIELPIPGFYERSQIPMGRATRFKPSLDLLTICAQWGVAPGDHKEHFAQATPPEPIVLRASKKQSVLEALPILADWPEHGIDCCDLMYLESEIIVQAMLELIRNHSAPVLSVHDSLIVKIKDQHITTNALGLILG